MVDDTGEHWEKRSLCKNVDPEIFFPDKGGSTREAKKVCSNCLVMPDCAADRVSTLVEERFGILAGLSERERRKIFKSRSEGEGFSDYELVMLTLFSREVGSGKNKKPYLDDAQKKRLIEFGRANNLLDLEADYGYAIGIKA